MSRSLSRIANLIIAAIIAVGTSPATVAATTFEKVPLTLEAKNFLPVELLSGNGYSVEKLVSSDGFMNTYKLQSDYGSFEITGTSELLARIQEIKATKALETLEQSEEFKSAAKGAVTGMVEGGKALVTDPVETTKSAAKGIGRWMNNMGNAITSDDPNQDSILETAVGYDAVKRGYAIEMGVDPYTEFEPFQEHLASVAQATTAGSLVTSMAINVGTEGTLVGTIASVAKAASMKSLLKDNPPATLARINKEKLLEMGTAEHAADALLKNYNYSPTQITFLVEALSLMGDIEGRDILIAYATSAPDKEVARFMTNHTIMLQRYIEQAGPGKVVSADGVAWLLYDGGQIVGVFPSDYLAWIEGVAKATNAASTKAKPGPEKKSLYIKGPVSNQARGGLEASGWEVIENTRFRSPDEELQ